MSGYHGASGGQEPHSAEAYAYEAQQPAGPAGGGAVAGGRAGGVPDGLIVGGLGLALSLTVLVWSSTGLAGWLAHGNWPPGVTFSNTSGAIRAFLTNPTDIPAAWPGAAADVLPSAGTLWLVFFAQLLLIFATFLWVAIRIGRWRQRRRLARQQAIAGRAPAPHTLPGPRTAEEPLPHAGTAGPYAQTATDQRTEPLGAATPAHAGRERLTPVTAVLKAPAGAVVTDPDGALYQRTARQREKLGPVQVYDPDQTSEAPSPLRWAPHQDCEQLATARSRAVALLASVRPTEAVRALDAETAETLLRGYLHAAALTGVPFSHVLRWVRSQSADPGKTLRSHPRAAPGLAMEYDAAFTIHPGRRDAALALLERALAGLDDPGIRQTCAPGRVDLTALRRLISHHGTLYIAGDSAASEPLRRALLESVQGRLRPVDLGS